MSQTYKNQLTPPPELAPPSIKHLPVPERIALWASMVDEGDQMVREGFRRRLGPEATEADVDKAFLEWLERYYEEHDKMLVTMLTNLHRADRPHGK